MNSFIKIQKIEDLNKLFCENKLTEDEFRKLAYSLCTDEYPVIAEKMKLTVEQYISDKRFRDKNEKLVEEYIKECKKIKDVV